MTRVVRVKPRWSYWWAGEPPAPEAKRYDNWLKQYWPSVRVEPLTFQVLQRFFVCVGCGSSPVRAVPDYGGIFHQCFACGAEWFGAQVGLDD